MELSIQKALNDKLYDKRKSGALELEKSIRDAVTAQDHDRIAKIVHQLCQDYAYAVHQPHARNGGLIGLAAASIALGAEVARYLEEIVPPVLACFNDQDARVRYYACESMYNIAKVAKGEILLYFNEVFDALCKLAADSELSVKNGAELLDRLIKDIVSESAANYVSVLHAPDAVSVDSEGRDDGTSVEYPTAFSLSRFIPLLQERIYVINPFTRTFLVSWITLLDSIPDLELISYLPSFLSGLLRFLSDTNEDVRTATQTALERFLNEVKKTARIKRGIAERGTASGTRPSGSSIRSRKSSRSIRSTQSDTAALHPQDTVGDGKSPAQDDEVEQNAIEDEKAPPAEEDWIPGQDAEVDHPRILDILVTFLSDSSEEQIQLTTLRWIDSFFEICPEDILPFVPRLLSQVLPALSSSIDHVCQAANRVNNSLREYILTLPEEAPNDPVDNTAAMQAQSQHLASGFQHAFSANVAKEINGIERRESVAASKVQRPGVRDTATEAKSENDVQFLEESGNRSSSPGRRIDLDYQAAVNSLTLQFLNEHEATRVAALGWLIMLHKRARGKILAIDDGTFPALLKTLSDPAEAVVTRDLQLLSQISKNSDDSYFTSFMVNLLRLFCTDRKLLETRGNLIIRQLCVSLSAERIYRTLADCLEKDEDLDFASIMVQNLNNNLITAPELADLRKRLRNLETRDGQTFFIALFRSWCYNAVATFSLCLLAQAYEQAYNLLQIFGDLEMTVNMLIQIDKLVQLLESPVFTYLRLQLLEPERYPHLYKCLYGLLMLLPQSAAFAALKNRLNSVSAIGYLHIVPRTTPPTPGITPFERPNRLKSRDDGGIKWAELLEKFRNVQERARRAQNSRSSGTETNVVAQVEGKEKKQLADQQGKQSRPALPGSIVRTTSTPAPGHKPKSSLSNLGRFAKGVGAVKGKR